MKISSFSFLISAAAALTLLSGCGAGETDMANDPSLTAAVMVGQNAPVADCESQGGCNRPQYIDRLAEQYHADAEAPPAPAAQPEQPVQPAQPVLTAQTQTGQPGQPVVQAGQAVQPGPDGAVHPAGLTIISPDNAPPTDNSEQATSAPPPDAAGQPQA
jgi:hypothetical protein